jgi:nucleoside-diphosphate-sugar epimerase
MILVTGGAGYIGSKLVPALLESAMPVRVVDTLWFGNSLPTHPQLEIIRGDLFDFDVAWLEDVDAIIHLAGLSNDVSSEFAPELSINANVGATARLAEAASEKASRRRLPIKLIFASTCSVYGRPTNGTSTVCDLLSEEYAATPTGIYARSKLAAELDLLRLAASNPHFCPVILRMGTVFGLSPRMRFDLVVNAFALDAWRKRVLTLEGAEEIWRPLLHIDDAVGAYIGLLSRQLAQIRQRIFNLLGSNHRIGDLATELASAFGQYSGVFIEVRRNELANNGGRSYCADGQRITEAFGIRPRREIIPAAISIWKALARGDFGSQPQANSRYFNVQCLEQTLRNNSTFNKAVPKP